MAEAYDDFERVGPLGLPPQVSVSLRWGDRKNARKLLEGLSIPTKLVKAAPAVAWALYSEANGQNRMVSYSRTRDHYAARPRRYRNPLYTFAHVPPAFDWLDEVGLIHHEKAPAGQRGWQSAAAANAKLLDLGHAVVEAGGAPKLLPLAQPIVIRGPNGELLDFTPTPETVRMTRDLNCLNEAIAGTEVSGCQAALCARIFNTTGATRAADLLLRGGRFYGMGGAWQSLPEAMRLQLQIAGEGVVEIDYHAIHPSFLYQEVGAIPPADCYEMGRWPRSLVKFGLLVLINADEGSARGAIAHHPDMLTFQLASSLPTSPAHLFAQAGRLISDIEKLHAPIADAFNSDAGARLMRKDSDIANAVMMDMIGKGVLVLPVHDSFLVPASKADLLAEAMVKAARQHGLMEPKLKRSDRMS